MYDFSPLLEFNSEAVREISEYEEFDEIRTQIQGNPDFYIEDEDSLYEFLYPGGAAIIADNITSAYASGDKEKEVLGWSLHETTELLRLKYKARMVDFEDEKNKPEFLNTIIADLNNELYATAINVVQMVMYLPEHMEHLKKHPVRKIPPFNWTP